MDLAYVAIIAAAIRLPATPAEPLFAVAGGTVLLIFIGIHNARDVVTYLPFDRARSQAGRRKPVARSIAA